MANSKGFVEIGMKTERKNLEYTYKQGKLITATAWKINGERCIETDVVEGDGVGV